MGRFALPPPVPVPMMRRLTEYSASWVKIPARIAGMPQAVEQTRDKARQHTDQRGRHKGDAHRQYR